MVMVTTWVASQKFESRTARIISIVSPSDDRWCATRSEAKPDAPLVDSTAHYITSVPGRSKLRQVQKFTGASPETVRLDRLGGSSFALRKARVKEQLLKMAAELLGIYAARAAHPGFAFSEPDELYREFEAEFPWEETPDQAKAIDDVIADMTKRPRGSVRRAQGPPDEAGPPPPMDRLIR